ncbi:MAG: glycosyltransferase family 4 protein [Bacteroidales bacterium]|nr:glycosyltransferase family 4 protein [Bacteroidales bacterium]MBN2749131.1 glycosyltransferase family 4 protein [Bacteroidales bacterium]
MTIRVVVVSPFNSTYSSGIAEAEILKGLAQQGVEIEIILSKKSSFIDFFTEAGIAVHERYPESKVDSTAISFIRSRVLGSKASILYLTRGKAITNGIAAAHGLNVKVVTYMGSNSLHWFDPTSLLTHLNKRVDKIICNSKDIERHIRAQHLAPKNKTITIYKGYKADWFAEIKPIPPVEMGIPLNAFVVVCLANVRRIKGLKYLIKAASHIKKEQNVHFIIAGSGTDKKRYKKLRDSSKLKENIHLIGHVDNAVQLVAAASVYVQPSIKEGLGRAIQEAMCLGIPQIVTNAGGCVELVSNGKSGIVVPKKKPKAIAQAISELQNNPELRGLMGYEAKKRIANIFSIEISVSRMYHLFSSLMEEIS